MKRKDRKPPPDLFGPPPEFLTEQLRGNSESQQSHGNSIEPADHIWRGYDGNLADRKDKDGRFFVDKYCDDNRDPPGALRQIIMAIVESGDVEPNSIDKEQRADRAFHALLGTKGKPGPKPGQLGIDRETIVREAALEFFRRSVDERLGIREWKSCIAFVLGDEVLRKMKSGADGRTFENFYNELRPEITKDEDRLLFEASATGLPEWERRGWLIARVIRDLIALGIIKKPPEG